MENFAVIMGNQVVNLIVADSKEAAEELTLTLCVPAEGAFLGDIYDPESGTFTTPQQVEEEVVEASEIVAGATMTPEEEAAFAASLEE